jgi:hypothetical protein
MQGSPMVFEGLKKIENARRAAASGAPRHRTEVRNAYFDN